MESLERELESLREQGVFGENVYCVTQYKPGDKRRRACYTKIVYLRGGADGKKFHSHVRRNDEVLVWEKWYRTLRYRQLQRLLYKMRGNESAMPLNNICATHNICATQLLHNSVTEH
jgi:hypothetical protein